MKIELIWFNLNCPVKVNTGISIISNELVQAGHTVKVLHLNERMGLGFDIEKIKTITSEFNPELLALSFGSNHLEYVKILVPLLKDFFPKIKIICGGVHSTLKPEEVIQVKGVDFIFLGEADGLFVKFVDNLQNGRNYERMKSIWVARNGEIIKNSIQLFPDISNQTFPDFNNVDYYKIIELNRGIYETIATRGCIYNCLFCFNHSIRQSYKKYMENYNQKYYFRKRSVRNVIDEIKIVLKKFNNISLVQFSDDDLSQDRKWFIEFTKLYAEEVAFPYSANFLLNNIDGEVAKYVAQSNCLMVKIGIECENEDRRRNFLKKPISNKQIEKGVVNLRKYEINIRNSIMLGIPGEVKEDIIDTLRYNAELKIDSTRLCVFYPLVGTKAYDYCKKLDLMKNQSYDNFDELSILKWDKGMELFIEKIIVVYPWVLNIYLNDSISEVYQELFQKVLKMDEDEWKRVETKRWINEKSFNLAKKYYSKKIPFYYNPFSDRPDVTFLYRERMNQFPNIEEVFK